jgi:hypothetical protein
MEHRHPKGVKPKTRERKLSSGVYWQGVLKQNGLKQGIRVMSLLKGKYSFILPSSESLTSVIKCEFSAGRIKFSPALYGLLH